jgi:hypothetical protein
MGSKVGLLLPGAATGASIPLLRQSTLSHASVALTAQANTASAYSLHGAQQLMSGQADWMSSQTSPVSVAASFSARHVVAHVSRFDFTQSNQPVALHSEPKAGGKVTLRSSAEN